MLVKNNPCSFYLSTNSRSNQEDFFHYLFKNDFAANLYQKVLTYFTLQLYFLILFRYSIKMCLISAFNFQYYNDLMFEETATTATPNTIILLTAYIN